MGAEVVLQRDGHSGVNQASRRRLPQVTIVWAIALAWAVLVYIGIDFGFWGKVLDMSNNAERVWRAAGYRRCHGEDERAVFPLT